MAKKNDFSYSIRREGVISQTVFCRHQLGISLAKVALNTVDVLVEGKGGGGGGQRRAKC